ncbi:diacylglycerol kinase family protein [Microbacterium sp. 10M-3C3]|jgi:diacylglycerol kinase family enzyme|uniref:diacylglycerol/lipid kinase family protein n=1 Tax=Microbacterium sp. 10M-3C3 TaxID=2483401 RepID=UPI000F63179D|nr:diacylglycerol kinase family protein [Microbacterium sp. 10M-3C3]
MAASDGSRNDDSSREPEDPEDPVLEHETRPAPEEDVPTDTAEFAATSIAPDAAEAEQADEVGAPGPEGASKDAPHPAEAAAPDDVIREPEDVEPDTADGEHGEARRVTADGEHTTMTAPETDLRRAALVYNPIKTDPAQLRARVAELSAEAEWAEPLFFETTVDDLGDDATRAAVHDGVDAVLVAGGDGTVRAVAEALTDTGIPLTIVPSGTGNLLARNLNLPLDDADAMIRATFAGDVLSVDVGVARLRRTDGSTEEHGFVVMAGMGLDAAMIANTRPELKKTVGWVAYVDGAARSLVTAKPFRVVYQLDEHRLHSSRVQSILFANCGALPAGIALIPDASITDGQLDVAIIQPAGPLGWLGVWRKIWWDNSFLRRFRAGRRVLERRGRDSSVHYRQGRQIETATAPAQPVELDGDEFGEATRIHCRIVPGGLQVAVPAGHPTASL